MLVIAYHDISNPKEFWNAAKVSTQHLPGSLRVHAIYPSRDQKSGTCIWEANNVQEVQNFLDKNAGKYAKNFCYELDQKEAIGLPQIKQSMAHAN